MFGVSNATALNVPSALLPGPRTPLVTSGPRVDVSPHAALLLDRPSTEPQLSWTDTSLANGTDIRLVDTANSGSDDDTFIQGSISLSTQIDELQDSLPEHICELFRITVDVVAPSTCRMHDLLHGVRDLLDTHQQTFATSSTDLGFCSILQHDIDTGDAPPIKQSPR